MGTKYSSTVSTDLSTYNGSPPSDDGSQTEANKVKWSTIKEKLSDIVKTAVENFDTGLTEQLDEGPDAKTTAYTTALSDFNKILEVTGATTISLLDPTAAYAGYRVKVKNANTSGTVTVQVDGGATVDGLANIQLSPNQVGEFMVNVAGTAYVSIGGDVTSFPPGTKMMFAQATAPLGWTIDTSFDGRMVLVKGTIADGAVNGGDTGGTHQPDLDDKVSSHTHDYDVSHSHNLVADATVAGTNCNTNKLSGSTKIAWTGTTTATTNRDYCINGSAAAATLGQSSAYAGAGTTDPNVATNYEPKYVAVIVASKD